MEGGQFLIQLTVWSVCPKVGTGLLMGRAGPGLCQGLVWLIVGSLTLQLQDHSSLASGVCALVGEAGLEASAGLLARRAGACLLMDKARPRPLWGGRTMSRQLWAPEVFGQTVCWRVGLYPHSVVWSEEWMCPILALIMHHGSCHGPECS